MLVRESSFSETEITPAASTQTAISTWPEQHVLGSHLSYFQQVFLFRHLTLVPEDEKWVDESTIEWRGKATEKSETNNVRFVK